MTLIEAGKKAPAFSLKDKDATEFRLKDIDSQFVVLFFYPKDDTPGCTIEAKAFSDSSRDFARQNAMVIGISGGDENSKRSFCEKHDIDTILLSDPDFTVSQKYGVYGPKKFMGKTFAGISRTTFIIGEDRRILKVFNKVKPAQHVKEVLEYLAQANKESSDALCQNLGDE